MLKFAILLSRGALWLIKWALIGLAAFLIGFHWRKPKSDE